MAIPLTAEIRLRVTSREDAQALAAWLTAILGETVALTGPTAGREEGVWFVRGALVAAGLEEAIVLTTGEMVQVPGSSVPDDGRAARLSRLSGLSRPETRPDDGVDRRELHKRLREDVERQNKE